MELRVKVTYSGAPILPENETVPEERTYRVRQKEGLLKCGWEGNSVGVIIYGFT